MKVLKFKKNTMQIVEESLYGLQWEDYLVIAITLLFSIAIGVYFAIKDRNNKDLDNYLRMEDHLKNNSTPVMFESSLFRD